MSDLEARREARRRKILENAENRLKKITSKDDNLDEEMCHMINSKGSSSKTPQNVQRSLNEFSKKSGKIHLQPSKEVQDSHIANDKRVSFDPTNELRTIYQNPTVDDNDSTAEVEFQNFEERKSFLRDWIIVLLALIVRYLFLLSEQYPQLISKDFLFKYHFNKIFMPFFLYQITEYVFFKPFVPSSGILNMLFILNLGIRVENMHKIVIISRVMLRIIQDMMVYFFAFVCIDQLIVFITQEAN